MCARDKRSCIKISVYTNSVNKAASAWLAVVFPIHCDTQLLSNCYVFLDTEYNLQEQVNVTPVHLLMNEQSYLFMLDFKILAVVRS